MLLGHGDDSYQYTGIQVDFSSNIYAHADLSELESYLCINISLIKHYPEPEAFSLEKLIASHLGIPHQCVLVTNGATDAIYLVAQTLKAKGFRHYTMVTPTFSEYSDASRLSGLERRPFSLTQEDNAQCVAWICNPNNPTGRVSEQSEIDHFAKTYGMLVIDQSYENYTRKPVMQACEGIRYGNLIQLHSLTKTYAIPGLRLGYLTAPSEIITLLRQNLRPWSVNTLAIAAGKFLIGKGKLVVNDLDGYLDETQRLFHKLNAIEGVTVQPTDANFMLCHISTATAAQLKEHLAHEDHLLIRDASNFEGLDSHFFRVASQRKDENELLVAAIERYLCTCSQ